MEVPQPGHMGSALENRGEGRGDRGLESSVRSHAIERSECLPFCVPRTPPDDPWHQAAPTPEHRHGWASSVADTLEKPIFSDEPLKGDDLEAVCYLNTFLRRSMAALRTACDAEVSSFAARVSDLERQLGLAGPQQEPIDTKQLMLDGLKTELSATQRESSPPSPSAMSGSHSIFSP